MQDINEDNIFSKKNNNFQTLNMIHKIKKIKKKRKPIENIKKMEFPEVLTNITDVDPNIPIIEGFERFAFQEDDWDGHDTINDNVESGSALRDPRQAIIDFINYVYNTTVSYNRKMAAIITDRLSNNKKIKDITVNIENVSLDKDKKKKPKTEDANAEGNRSNDENLVYKYICIFEAILFSSFVVNNWYYLMFYNNFKDGVKEKLFDFSVDRIKKLSDDYLSNKILKYIVLYFIEFALFFPDNLQYFLINIVPSFFVSLFNHTLCYIFLFLSILYLSYNFASGFKNFLIDTINLNTKNFVVCLMYFTVIILFFIPDTPGFDAKKFNPTSFTGVFNLIWNVIRFLIIISISVPIGGFFCLVYFVFYSLFAMLFYNQWNTTLVSGVFKEMLKFLDNAKISISQENPSFFEMFIKTFNDYVEYISDYFFIIVLLTAFIYSLTDSLKNVTNSTLRSSLYFLDISIIFMILIFLIYVIKSKFSISSFEHLGELLNKFKNSDKIEKDYDFSVTIFYLLNLGLFLGSLGTLGYFLLLIVGFIKK